MVIDAIDLIRPLNRIQFFEEMNKNF